MVCQCERSVDPASASLLIKTELDSLGLKSHTRKVGKTGLVHKSILRSGAVKCVGWGKGLHSRLGAQYEALEHYMTTCTLNGERIVNLAGLSRAQIVERGQTTLDLHHFRWTHENSILSSHWSAYVELTDRDRVVYVPTAVVDPEFHRSKFASSDELLRAMAPIASNTGIAIGCTREDAILHALNELGERFFFSQLLLHGSLLRKSIPLRILAWDGSHSSIQDEFQVKIQLADISQPPQCAVLAQAAGNLCPRPLVGLGCSLDPKCAQSRALCELLQMLETVRRRDDGATLLQQEYQALRSFSGWPAFQRVARFNICNPPANLRIQHKSTELFGSIPPSLTVHDQIKTILEAWRRRGVQIFCKEIFASDSRISCVSLIAPDLGHFFLAYKSGHYVIPTSWQEEHLIPGEQLTADSTSA
jgi:ribosomal protein S12 methylthiotransferase accessory factor